MYKAIIVFFCLLFLNEQLAAQTHSVSLGSIGVCSSESILVPLKGQGLVNIGAITLMINYNSSQLVFTSLEDIDAQIDGLLFNVLSNPSRLSIVWSSTTGANFSDNVLLNINFALLSSSGEIDFAIDSCEIADLSNPPQILSIDYTNGFFFPSNPVIVRQPENRTVHSQSNVDFSVSSINATGYEWFESSDGGVSWSATNETPVYMGTHTDSLTIVGVPVAFSNNLYRCSVYKHNCNILSDEAVLLVDSIDGIDNTALTGFMLSSAPNPFTDVTRLSYRMLIPGNLNIGLFSIDGKQIIPIVERFHEPGQYIIDLNFVYLPTGLYFLKYLIETKHGVFSGTKKIEKN